jgi:hypothetical protein
MNARKPIISARANGSATEAALAFPYNTLWGHPMRPSASKPAIASGSMVRLEARTLISVLKTEKGGHEIADMHRPVLEALAEVDAERAGLLLRQHVEYFGELILKEGDMVEMEIEGIGLLRNRIGKKGA